jgi:autotransporter-associated beta strand protein
LSGSINGRTLLTKASNNTVTLSGTTDNVGLSLNVTAGTVILAKTSSHSPDIHAVGWNLPLLGMVVSGGTAQLGGTGGDQIYDSGNVTVTSGAFDTNGRSETLAALKLQGTGIGNAGALVNTASSSSTITPTGGTVLTSDTTIGVTQSGGSLTLNGAISGNVALAKVGPGTLILTGDPTWNTKSSLHVNGGTLRFNVVSGTATIGTGVTATVSSGATLELAGTVPALANGANRVNITNNSNALGVLVSGSHQQIGGIDGSGTTLVNAGSDLTANHIIQTALVIGGMMGSAATATIAASDASGNPLGQSDVEPTRMATVADGQEPAQSAGGSSSLSLLSPSGGGVSGDPFAAPADSSPARGVAAVPEPATILLLALGGLSLLVPRSCATARIFRRRGPESN